MKISSDYNYLYSNQSFSGYKAARFYALRTRFDNKFINRTLYNCDLEKLDGIQEGLKTFKGLSMKQIAFVLTDLHSINMISGCNKGCLHCYANAQPFISRASFESFKQIMDDILALKRRIGVRPVSHRGDEYIMGYFDADSIDMHLFDKNGKKHDAIELGRLIHRSTQNKTVFDTAGWDRNDKERQKIAEDYVNQLLKTKNSKHFRQINISLNPFNPKYVRALKDGYNPKSYSPLIPVGSEANKVKKSVKQQKAEDAYRDYIDNEVNTLFTFTPLLLDGKLNTIIRGLDKNVTNMDGCYMEDFAVTLSNILDRLWFEYLGDLGGERKVIKSKKMMQKAMNGYMKLFNDHQSYKLFSSGRMEAFYKVRHNGSLDGIEAMNKFRDISEKNFGSLVAQRKISATNMAYLKMITPDGKVYMYDNYSIIPTDIRLNTDNPGLSKPFSFPVKNFTVTGDMIDRI